MDPSYYWCPDVYSDRIWDEPLLVRGESWSSPAYCQSLHTSWFSDKCCYFACHCCTQQCYQWVQHRTYSTEHNIVTCFSLAAAIDYSLPSTTLTLTPSTPQVNQTVSILTDGIVLEGPETLSLLLQQVSGQPVTDLRSTTVTVIDKDGKCVSFDESSVHCNWSIVFRTYWSSLLCWGNLRWHSWALEYNWRLLYAKYVSSGVLQDCQ